MSDQTAPISPYREALNRRAGGSVGAVSPYRAALNARKQATPAADTSAPEDTTLAALGTPKIGSGPGLRHGLADNMPSIAEEKRVAAEAAEAERLRNMPQMRSADGYKPTAFSIRRTPEQRRLDPNEESWAATKEEADIEAFRPPRGTPDRLIRSPVYAVQDAVRRLKSSVANPKPGPGFVAQEALAFGGNIGAAPFAPIGEIPGVRDVLGATVGRAVEFGADQANRRALSPEQRAALDTDKAFGGEGKAPESWRGEAFRQIGSGFAMGGAAKGAKAVLRGVKAPAPVAALDDAKPVAPPVPPNVPPKAAPVKPAVKPPAEPMMLRSGISPQDISEAHLAAERFAEPARKLWAKGADKVEDAVTGAIDKIPGAQSLRKSLIPSADQVAPPKVRGESGPLQLSVNKARGQITADMSKIGDGVAALDDLDDVRKDAVYRYLGGEAESPPVLPTKAAQAVQTLKDAIQQNREGQHARGLLPENQFEQYPRYLVRHMKLADLAKKGGEGFGRDGAPYKTEPNIYRQDSFGVVVDMPAKEAAAAATPFGPRHTAGGRGGKSALVKFDDAASRDAFVKQLEANNQKSLIRDKHDPLSDAERASFGEVTDPAQAAALTMQRGARKVAVHDMLSSWEGIGKSLGEEWVEASDPKKAPKPGMVRVTDERFPAFRGKDVRSDLFEFAKEYESPKMVEATNDFAQLALDVYSEGMQGWKSGHTAKNPSTHGRNWLAMPLMGAQAGVNPLNPASWPYYEKAIRQLWKKGPEYEARLKAGVYKQDFASAEAFAAAHEAVAQKKPFLAHLARSLGDWTALPERLPGKAGRLTRRVNRKVGDVYGAPDDIVRGAAFERLLAKHGKDGWDKALAELDSDTYNYSKQGVGVRRMSNIPLVSPFFRFAADTYRINWNNLKKHPVRFAETVATIYVIQEALRRGTGTKPEEQEALEEQFGPMTLPIGQDEKGQPRGMDPRYVHPMGQLMSGPQRTLSGTDWRGYLGTALGGGEPPAVSLWNAMKDGRNSWGREITNPLDSAPERAWDIYREAWGPPLAGRGADRLEAAFEDRPYSPRRPVQSRLDAILSQLGGFSAGTLDYGMAQDAIGRGVESRARDIDRGARARVEARDGDPSADASRLMAETLTEARRRSEILRRAQESRK